MVSLFCRHNRFTADCPICSRGTVLEEVPGGGGARGGRDRGEARPAGSARRDTARGAGIKGPPHGASTYRGRYGAVGPYERAHEIVEVRLERVPGGLRLAEWAAGGLARRAPVLMVDDLVQIVERAGEAGALEEGELEVLRRTLHPRWAPADASGAGDGEAGSRPRRNPNADGDEGRESRHGASPGRSGELRDELRVEPLDGGRVRVSRWVLRPGTGWEMLDAPTMLPAQRYFEALGDAAARGLLG